jgi:hypothetical protein
MRQRIFVFGANLSGIHGKGAALHAKEHYGAEYGVPLGRTGSAYAIPTKGQRVEPVGGRPYFPVLPLSTIAEHARTFCVYAEQNPHLDFQLTAVGCGLAGYKPQQVAPLFAAAPRNVLFPPEWRQALPRLAEGRFWA